MQTPNASRFIEDHWNNGSRYGINANAVLTHFASWLLERRGQLPDHDQATLFTRFHNHTTTTLMIMIITTNQ